MSIRKVGEYVTSCRFWRCPECGRVIEKLALGVFDWPIGARIPRGPRWAGTCNCAACGAEFPEAEIYGGKYDIEAKARIAESKEYPQEVSVIVFQLLTSHPATQAQKICSELLNQKYPMAKLGKWYVIGRLDLLTIDEAYIVYKAHVEEGQLADLGEQFDATLGKDITGKDVAVLFFK